VYTYTGAGFSLNDAYAKNHWQRRKRKEELKQVFYAIIEAVPVPETISRCTLTLAFNARYDCSNNAALEKVFTDCLRGRGVIKDDNNKVLTEVTFRFDSTLPKQTFQFVLASL
jgi:hypothetical protein